MVEKYPRRNQQLLLWKTLPPGLLQFGFKEPLGARCCHDAEVQP